MRRFALILIAVLLVIALGGLTLLGLIELPPPTRTIETTLPNDRLTR